MQELSSIVILILCVYTVIGVLDQISIQIGVYTPLFAATFTGFLLGDIKSGLFIGATLQLATLGVATYGGATVPDYLSGAIIGTSYAILSQRGAEYGIAIAVPIGLLLTQLDILGRMTNVIFQHKADRYAEEGNYKGVEMCNVLGTLPWVLSRVIPVFIGLFFGETVIQTINNFIPGWFMNGLKAAGALLPAMGIAILMRYLPLKKYFYYFIIGFVAIAFSGGNMSVLAVALLGFAFASLNYYRTMEKGTVKETAGTSVSDDDEIEIDG